MGRPDPSTALRFGRDDKVASQRNNPTHLRLRKQIEDVGSELRWVVVPVTVDFPGWSSELAAVFARPLVNCVVRGFHLIVRTHVNCGGNCARGSGRIATLLQLNAARDIEFSGYAGAGVIDDVQASLAFEARVELVKRFADFGGEVGAVRASSDDGDRLFRHLHCLYGVWHESILAWQVSESTR